MTFRRNKNIWQVTIGEKWRLKQKKVLQEKEQILQEQKSWEAARIKNEN